MNYYREMRFIPFYQKALEKFFFYKRSVYAFEQKSFGEVNQLLEKMAETIESAEYHDEVVREIAEEFVDKEYFDWSREIALTEISECYPYNGSIGKEKMLAIINYMFYYTVFSQASSYCFLTPGVNLPGKLYKDLCVLAPSVPKLYRDSNLKSDFKKLDDVYPDSSYETFKVENQTILQTIKNILIENNDKLAVNKIGISFNFDDAQVIIQKVL